MNKVLLLTLYMFFIIFIVMFFVLVQPKDIFNIKFTDYTDLGSECF